MKEFFDHIIHVATQSDLDVTKEFFLQYIVEPIKLRMNLVMSWNNIQAGSKTILPYALEGKMRYNPNLLQILKGIEIE